MRPAGRSQTFTIVLRCRDFRVSASAKHRILLYSLRPLRLCGAMDFAWVYPMRQRESDELDGQGSRRLMLETSASWLALRCPADMRDQEAAASINQSDLINTVTCANLDSRPRVFDSGLARVVTLDPLCSPHARYPHLHHQSMVGAGARPLLHCHENGNRCHITHVVSRGCRDKVLAFKQRMVRLLRECSLKKTPDSKLQKTRFDATGMPKIWVPWAKGPALQGTGPLGGGSCR